MMLSLHTDNKWVGGSRRPFFQHAVRNFVAASPPIYCGPAGGTQHPAWSCQDAAKDLRGLWAAWHAVSSLAVGAQEYLRGTCVFLATAGGSWRGLATVWRLVKLNMALLMSQSPCRSDKCPRSCARADPGFQHFPGGIFDRANVRKTRFLGGFGTKSVLNIRKHS
jgi:hypothetical protein